MEYRINTKTLSLIKAQLENVATKDETRYHLQHVQIRQSATGGMVIIESCDGHIMSQVETEDPQLCALVSGAPIYIHRDQLPVIKNILKQIKNFTDIEVSRHSNNVLMMLPFGSIQLGEVTTFPKLDQLKPNQSPKAIYSFDAELLLKVAKSFDGSKLQKGKVVLEFVDPLSPIVVRREDEHYGLVMPVRNEKAVGIVSEVAK